MKSKIVILVFVLALSGVAHAQTTYIILEEDFEGLTLGPSPEESPGTEGVWTETPPPGWIVDDSGVPGAGDPSNDGVTDWAGWAFADKDFWIATNGQLREEFLLGQGTIAVADGDEWDDATRATGLYNALMTTSAADVSRAQAGTLELKFDSSWRPYANQLGVITVQYDGGEPNTVLRWESNASSTNYKDHTTNETVVVNLDNPTGAGNMVLSFGYLDAGNDWWWAFDNIMVTAVPRLEVAYNPNPANRATDLLPSKVVLSWSPGEFVGGLSPKHKIILSDNFDDVKNGTAVIATQDPNSYDLYGLLDFSTTYYWRIDEAKSTAGWDEGSVWQFTTEPFSNPIAGENITATAFSTHQSDVDVGPENTINGSGLDANDLHSTEPADMWLSGGGDPGTIWIEYELDKVHKLHEMWVWNANQMVESLIGFGFKDVTVEYSTNGTDYTVLGTTHEFARAPGTSGYARNTTVDFGSAAAKYVRLTANSNWGGIMNQYGLSEVRFLSVPVFAREPSPDPGTTDVAVDVTLGFKTGREAVTHDVYLSTDEQAVIDGNAPVTTVTETSYGPLSLDLGTTYYWKINEVNEADTTTTWESDIWNFSTQEFIVVDGFEDYNDYPPNEIWFTWVDGYGVSANGATVGYPAPDWNLGEHYVETTIVNGGEQAMPFFYSNTGGATYSEGKRTFAVPQDWTKAGMQTLALYFHGTAGNTGQLYVEVNGSKVVYPGDAGNLARAGWQAWNIELASFSTDLQSVTTLAIGIDGNGASGTLYFDDFRLYSYSPEFITPVEPNSAGLIGHWKFDGDMLDYSSLGNDGTGFGDPTFVAGTVGSGALDFDGDDYVVLGEGGALNFGDATDFSVLLWIKWAGTSSDPAFMSNKDWNSGSNTGYVIADGGSTWQWNWNVSGGSRVDYDPDGPTLDDNQWHHLCVTHDRDGFATFYVDGVYQDRRDISGSTGSIDSGMPHVIAQDGTTTYGSTYAGLIDDARIYDYALSYAEVGWLSGRTLPFDKPF